MSYFEFPHTRDYDGDLGYILKKLGELTAKYSEFMQYNQIRFADPIEWAINRQYAAWNLVFDVIMTESTPGEEQTIRGYNLYMAIKPVPIGISISNEDYWQLVIPFTIDTELNIDSYNLVTNNAITSVINQLSERINDVISDLGTETEERIASDNNIIDSVGAANARIDAANVDIATNAENIATVNGAVTTLDARVTSIAQTIVSGGTTGDAELADIRVGANGITYNNAGDAVRGQFEELANQIGDYGIFELPADSLAGSSTLRKTFDHELTAGVTYRVSISFDAPGWNFKKLTVYGYDGSNYTSLAILDDIDDIVEFTPAATVPKTYFYMEHFDGGSGTLTAEIQLSALSDNKTITNDLYNIEDAITELKTNNRTVNELKTVLTDSVLTYGGASNAHSYSARSAALVMDSAITGCFNAKSFKIYIPIASVLTFGLGTLDSGTLTITHVKTISSSEIGYHTYITDFELNPELTYYPFVFVAVGATGFSTSSATSKYYTFDGSSGIEVGDDFTTTTTSNGINIATIEAYKLIDVALSTASSFKNTITVAKSGGMYNTIMDAVNSIDNDSATNPVTILIYPGIYDEVVNIGSGRFISLVGINRDTCIIRDTSGRYVNSPVLVNGNFTIENLTIIANHDNAGDWYPTWDGGNTTFASYCVHVDGGTFTSEAPAFGRIANCRLYSECNHAIGMGLRNYETVQIENCDIIRKASGDYINSNYLGAMGCHSQNTGEEHEEHLIIKNSYFDNAQSTALQLWKLQGLSSPMDITAIGNSLVANNLPGSVYFKNYQTVENRMLTAGCYGNNANELNYGS